MWGPIAGAGLILGTFAWMGYNESMETGEGWARIGLRWLFWSAVFVGVCIAVIWAWEGLSKT